MPPTLWWPAAAIVVSSLVLWPVTHDRSRLRTAWALVFLFAAAGFSETLPASWRPAAPIIQAVSIALIELASIQIAVVVVFDLALRRVHIAKFAIEILILTVYAAVLVNLLYRTGVNVTGIFATSAVAAAVIGFALQDMLSNIASGIALQLERGLAKNDFIECGSYAGHIRHVRLRHTAIQTPNGETVFLPNSQLTRTPVAVHSRAHRHFIPFAMPYSIDPHELTAAVESALRASPIPGVAPQPPPACILREMTPGHTAYAAVVWFTDPGDHAAEISAVLTRVYYALKRGGIPASGVSTLLEVRRESRHSSRHNPVDVLRRTPILRLLSDPDLHGLAAHLRQLSFAAGEHIIRQGEPGDSMYFVVEGAVGIVFRSAEGIDRQFTVVEPGDFFGEASLLTGEARTAAAVALSRVECYRLDKAGLEGFMQRLPELAEDMSVVMAHRQTELDSVREKLDRETALRREAESQNEFLTRIRRFFGTA